MTQKDTTRPAPQGDIMDLVGGNGPWQWIVFSVIIVLGIPTAMHNLVMSFYAPNLEHWCARPEGSNWTLEDWKNYALPQQDQKCSRYGRKPIIFGCIVIIVLFSLGCAFSTSFLMFAVCRFFVAVGVAGADNSSFVLMMEALGPKYRSYYGIAINFGWCIGFTMLPLIVWLIKDWFWIQIVLTVPSVFLLSSWWLLPESPRWLLTNGKEEKALRSLLAAGKRNGMALTNLHDKIKGTLSKTSKGYEVKQSYGSILHLVISSGIWKQTLIIFYLCFMVGFVYYGLTYNTNELAGDPYINFAASGAIEIPAYTLTIFIIASLGRKGPQGVSMGCSGLACFLMLVIPQEPWWLGVTMSMIGKFCIAAAFGILYVYTAEIFPTSVRSISMGSATMSGQVGSVIAPFVRELSHFTHPAVPQVMFGILAMIGGALVVFLPETNNISVPNTLGEATAANSFRSLLAFERGTLTVPDPWWLGVAMTMTGKFCIASFGILYVYATEIFPTSVRAVSLGLASISARIGIVIAPFVRELSHATHPAVPQVIFGTFALIGTALLVAFLPETKKVTVPNTFEEAAEVKRIEEHDVIGTDESIL